VTCSKRWLHTPPADVIRKADLDDFLARNPRALLFFSGDVVQRPEGLDVAVVVRKLLTSYQGRLRLGSSTVVTKRR